MFSKFFKNLFSLFNRPGIERIKNAFTKMFKETYKSSAYKDYCLKLYSNGLLQWNQVGALEWKRTLEYLEHFKSKEVLDLGSGFGSYSKFLQKELNCYVEALDAIEVPEIQSDLEDQGINFIKADINQGLQLKSYDLILSIDSLYFLKDTKEVLKNLHNHLKIGGKLIFSVNSIKGTNKWVTALADLGIKFELHDFTQDNHEHTLKALEVLEQKRSEFSEEGRQVIFNAKIREYNLQLNLHERREVKRTLVVALKD